MEFNQIFFIFVFLPISVILYRFLPKRSRILLLIFLSFLFYAWGNPVNLLCLILSIGFNYIAGIELELTRSADGRMTQRMILVTSVAANVILLSYFKYLQDTLPVGISFYTFMVLSYLFDVASGKVGAQRNLLKLTLYISFFPKITSGPIVEYNEMERQLDRLEMDSEDVTAGMQLFLVGLMKKVLLADQLGNAFTNVSAAGMNSMLSAWLSVLFYSLRLYFDFSGYSDMAIGLARIFGFHFDKNFDYPYRALGMSDFWRRWHISLGRWFRDYVYIPLGGNRVTQGRMLLNLLIVWILTGIWHGNTWNFLIWGLYHGAFVILEKFVIRDRINRAPKTVRILLTDLIVFIGWIFFFAPDPGAAMHVVGRLFGIGVSGFAGDGAGFYLRQYLPLLVVALVGSGPWFRKIYQRVFYENQFWLGEGTLNLATVVMTVFALVLSLSYMVGGTYSTFLYYKF